MFNITVLNPNVEPYPTRNSMLLRSCKTLELKFDIDNPKLSDTQKALGYEVHKLSLSAI